MGKKKDKCVARGQSCHWCDGCVTNSTKCPQRDKYRNLRHTKKGKELYGLGNGKNIRKGKQYEML